MQRELDHLVALIFRSLPQDFNERRSVLAALHSILPTGYVNRGHVGSALEFLNLHEEKQLTFLAAFDQSKGTPIP